MSAEAVSDDVIPSDPNDRRRVGFSNTPKVKRIKLESVSASNAIPSTSNNQRQADFIPNDQPQAEIFKLKVNHFEELFDWLCLRDMVSLGQTCKRMQRIVGNCLKTNYAAIQADLVSAGMMIRTRRTSIKLNGLSSFMEKCVCCTGEGDDYDSAEGECYITHIIPRDAKTEQFKSLTKITIKHSVLTEEELSYMKQILSQLETLKLNKTNFIHDTDEFYESFLQYCTNIKTLCIAAVENEPIIGADNSWLLRNYPKLEHFGLRTYEIGPVDELKTFFEQNPNISSVAINDKMIVENKDILENLSAIKLNILIVEFREMGIFKSSQRILNRLYERGFYKQFHAYFPYDFMESTEFDQETANQMTSLNGLTKLFIRRMKDETDLSHLIHLKELCICNPSTTNMATLAVSLVNLNMLEVMYARWNDILPFICHSASLKKVILSGLKENNSEKLVEDQRDDPSYDESNPKRFDENIPNIEQLNKNRSKLANARKVTLYVDEQVYLAIKWAENQTIWSFIEVKRGASYDAIHHLEYSNSHLDVI